MAIGISQSIPYIGMYLPSLGIELSCVGIVPVSMLSYSHSCSDSMEKRKGAAKGEDASHR